MPTITQIYYEGTLFRGRRGGEVKRNRGVEVNIYLKNVDGDCF